MPTSRLKERTLKAIQLHPLKTITAFIHSEHRSPNECHLVHINSAAEHDYLDCLAHYNTNPGDAAVYKNVMIGEGEITFEKNVE